jgi:hypothetical protein
MFVVSNKIPKVTKGVIAEAAFFIVTSFFSKP